MFLPRILKSSSENMALGHPHGEDSIDKIIGKNYYYTIMVDRAIYESLDEKTDLED